MIDPQQAREDAKQLRAMLAMFPAEQVHVQREWASRLASYAERLARLEEGLTELRDVLASRTAHERLGITYPSEVAPLLTALLGEGETDEGGA